MITLCGQHLTLQCEFLKKWNFWKTSNYTEFYTNLYIFAIQFTQFVNSFNKLLKIFPSLRFTKNATDEHWTITFSMISVQNSINYDAVYCVTTHNFTLMFCSNNYWKIDFCKMQTHIFNPSSFEWNLKLSRICVSSITFQVIEWVYVLIWMQGKSLAVWSMFVPLDGNTY